MISQTAKSIEDILRLALRITSEDARRNVCPGVKVSYFFRGENQNLSAVGEDMYVWQDYVAGTDPTDPKSQFMVKIEMVDGEPVVIWSPKLSEAEAAKRIYTTYGKKTLEGSHGGEPRTAARF